MNNSIKAISGLCEHYPVEPKVIFTSSRQVGYNISNTLLRTGINWANLEFISPAQYAREFATDLVADGWNHLPQDLPAFIVLHLLDQNQELRTDLIGSQVRLTPGVVSSVERTISSIRMAGVPIDQLDQTSNRQQAVARLIEKYDAFLQKHFLLDDAAVLSRAISETRTDTQGEVVFGEYATRPFEGLNARFVAKMMASATGRKQPNRAQTQSAVKADVSTRYSIGSKAEAVGVLEEVLENETLFDDVEIAYTVESKYLNDLVSISHWLPESLTFANGTPAMLTSPGQALLGYTKWIASGIDNSILVNLLRSRKISIGKMGRSRLRADFAAKNLEQLRAGFGIDDLFRIANIIKKKADANGASNSAQPTLFDNHGKIERADGFKQLVTVLAKLAPRKPVSSLTEIVNNCIRFLETFSPTRSSSDEIAAESIIQRLRNLDAFEISVPTKLGYELVGNLARAHKLSASVAVPGKISVVPLEKAGLSGRKKVYIVGMDDESYPGTERDNYFLTLVDGEIGFSKNDSRTAKEFAVQRLLSDDDIELILVSQRADPSDGSEIHPSALVREFAGNAHKIDYRRVGNGGVSIRPSFGLTAKRTCSDYPGVVQLSYPWLTRGWAAKQLRDSSCLTSFDGVLGVETPELSLADRDNPISASAMERLSGCAYRYFLQRVLNVRIPEALPDRFTWLSALQKGRLLHDLLHKYYDDPQVIDSSTNVADAEGFRRTRLAGLLEQLMEIHQIENPAHNAAGFAQDKEKLLLAAQIFLSADDASGVPYGLELKFGFQGKGSITEGPIRIEMGDASDAHATIHMRGAIDRVDRVGNEFTIWDYKSGSTYNFENKPLKEDLRHMQWALYSYALEEILKLRGEQGEIVQSGYFFVGDRGNGQRVTDAPPAREEMGRRLEPLMEFVSRGTFVHAHRDSGECRFCDFNAVCAGEQITGRNVGDLESMDERSALAIGAAQKWLKG